MGLILRLLLKCNMKAIYDIESMSPWQAFKQGELTMFTAARHPGKSVINQMYGSMGMSHPKFKIHDQAQVDGETWYTVGVNKEVCEWLHTQPAELFYEHPGEIWRFSLYEYDIHEKLYTLMALRWT